MKGRLQNRHILLGISGGIAAYKSAELVRRLQDLGAEVRVVMTSGAQQFITPLTLQALSGNPVHTELLDPEAEAGMSHIELARWADRILIAPATADLIARLASGRADDLLTTLCLASSAPLQIAPAMNQGMWRDAQTRKNVSELAQQGAEIFGPAEGSQACGDIGPGRMLEPEDLAHRCAESFDSRQLDGVKVVITAGPTREAIDPVRYISNHSSGKMGFALAQAAADQGAAVTLVAGPVNLATPDGVTRIDVESAQQMCDAVESALTRCDIFIGSAAVADYRPAEQVDQKIKKDADEMTIHLVKNPDIISRVANNNPRPFTVGFAAETQDVESYARSKLERKNLDLIISNDVANKSIGFNSDENAVTVISSTDSEAIPQTSKHQLARLLVDQIVARYRKQIDTP